MRRKNETRIHLRRHFARWRKQDEELPTHEGDTSAEKDLEDEKVRRNLSMLFSLFIYLCVSALQAYAVLSAYLYIYVGLSAQRSWEGSVIGRFMLIYAVLRNVEKDLEDEEFMRYFSMPFLWLSVFLLFLWLSIFVCYICYFSDYLYVYVCVSVPRTLRRIWKSEIYIYAVLSTYPYIYMYVRVGCGMKKDLIEGDLFIIYRCRSLCLSIYLCVSECDSWEGSGK